MKQRFTSLDIFRGLTVFLMIMVNNGYGGSQYSQMSHSQWHGLTLCDLVFPFFLFMVGVSAYLALSKDGFTPTPSAYRRIALRTVKFFLIGVALHAWDAIVWNPSILLTPLDLLANLRIWGVLQRIALCYGIVSIILLQTHNVKWLFTIATSLLVIYGVILHFGNGYEASETNILCIVDRTLFGEAHLYHKSPIDPEGLVGTISSVAHVLIGAIIGYIVKFKGLDMRTKMIYMLIIGILILAAGILINLPINKRIWSPSYVLITCGISTLMLILLNNQFCTRFLAFFNLVGRHAFAAYILSEMLCSIVYILGINEWVYSHALIVCSPQMSSLIYCFLFSLFISNVAIAPSLIRDSILKH